MSPCYPYLVIDIVGLEPSSRTEKAQREVDINGTFGNYKAASDEFHIDTSQVRGMWSDLNVDCQRGSTSGGRIKNGGDGKGYHISNTTALKIYGLSASDIGQLLINSDES